MATITIVGKIGLPTGEPHIGTVYFTPVRTPTFNGTTVVFTSRFSVTTDDAGEFEQVFEPGVYSVDCVVGGRVTANPIRQFQVQVPNSDTDVEINFSSLRILTEVSYAADFGGSSGGGGGDVDPATTTTFGTVKLDQPSAAGVVVTKATITGADALGVLFRPVAGELHILNSTTGNYHKLLCQTVGGIPALGIDQTGVAFASLPTA